MKTVEVEGAAGDVQRVVARSETLAFMIDGRVVASAPTIIVLLDTVSRDILEVTDLTVTRNVSAIGLPAPEWWTRSAARMRHVVPSTYGLAGLDDAE